MKKRTLVLGASDHSWRYSYMAINKLFAAGHTVFALGKHTGRVGNVEILTHPGEWAPIDTVSIYLNPHNQESYYDYLLNLQPTRVIFNPGAENDELSDMLKEKDVKIQEACTLVLL